MKFRTYLFATATFALIGGGVGVTPVVAQTAQQTDASADSVNTGIAEIIVTAERREQNVQKAPLTIQVLSGADLLKAGLSSATDISKLTTGVEIGEGGASAQIFVRGVGSFTFTPLTNPGVAFNVDGVYVGRSNGVNGNFYDIARVEVLKGPQGTLYGRNANGGAINVITNDAKIGKTTLDLNLEAGNYDLIHTSGAVNLPLGQNAAIRGAFNIVNRDGYLSNGSNDDVQQSARVRFIWEPSDDVTLRLNADYSNVSGKGGDYVYLPRRPGSSPYEAQSEPAANAYMQTQFGPAGFFTYPIKDDGRQKLEMFNLSAQLDWKLGDFATLTAIPAYRHLDAYNVTHFAGTLTSNMETTQKTLEVRLGNSSRGLTWVIGGYAFDESTPNATTALAIGSLFLSDNIQRYSPKTNAYAVFGQTTVEVLPSFRLIAGGRYTYEKQKLLRGSRFNRNLFPAPGVDITFGGVESFNAFTYKLGAEYDLSPRNMVYLTYSTGFKAGGLNQTIAPLDVYQPEKLNALEFGSRNRFFNNRLQLNFGAFHWKYKDIQDQRVARDPTGASNFLAFNSGSATLYGFNTDIVAKPTKNDTLSVSGEYTHSKYDSFYFQVPSNAYSPQGFGCKNEGQFANNATLPYTQQNGSNINSTGGPVYVLNCTGYQVARAPKWTGNLSYAHEFPLANDATVTLDGTVKYTSARWLNVDFIPSERDGSYAVVDANLTYTSANGGWSVGLFGRNLSKTVYYTGGIVAGFHPGLFAANIAPPRTYGIRANLKFGN